VSHAKQVRAAVLESALIFSPALQVACVVHAAMRWSVLLWKLLLPHAEQVRAAVLESALIFSPALHVACVVHEVSRCAVAVWKVFSSQAEQLRIAVVVSALIFWPAPHVGCAAQLALPSEPAYVFASHAVHSVTDEAPSAV